MSGYSTLAVAILAKRWDTAKAIISIAKAQYQKPEEEERRVQSYNDSDDSDYDSDMSVDDYDEPVSKPQLVDLANRLSTVKTAVPVGRLFAYYTRIQPGEKEPRSGTPLTFALEDADVQAFEQVLAIGEMCDPPITMTPQLLGSVIKSDEPALLDAVIRKFGFGLPVQTELEELETNPQHTIAEGESHGKKKTSKTYLGLNVNRVKRVDLATKGDPDAPTQIADKQIPLVWQAAQLNASKILTWLASSAPLEAYQTYMKTSTDEVAIAMKRLPKFGQRFPSLIGSTPTDIGENAVLAHLSGDSPKVETLQLLFSLYPDLKPAFVHKRVQGLQITTLHYICEKNLATEIFDFFTRQGADALVTDHRGCNIMHIVAHRNHLKLLGHIFTKLNRDQLALLLSQPINGKQSTVGKVSICSCVCLILP